MGFARSVLLKASRSQWLARQLRERSFFRRAVKRFMPGETLDAALDAAGQFAKAGLGSVLTELGEQVTNRAEAAAVRDHYLGVLEKIQRRKLPAHVSVKLTHLGLEASQEGCVQDVLKLAARAEPAREGGVAECGRLFAGIPVPDRERSRRPAGHCSGDPPRQRRVPRAGGRR